MEERTKEKQKQFAIIRNMYIRSGLTKEQLWYRVQHSGYLNLITEDDLNDLDRYKKYINFERCSYVVLINTNYMDNKSQVFIPDFSLYIIVEAGEDINERIKKELYMVCCDICHRNENLPRPMRIKEAQQIARETRTSYDSIDFQMIDRYAVTLMTTMKDEWL